MSMAYEFDKPFVGLGTRSGIYCIRNKRNGKLYVGSAVDIRARWRAHKYNLRRGKHHSVALQRSFNKSGPSAFEFDVIRFCEPCMLMFYEQESLNAYKPFGRDGYNQQIEAGSNLGLPCTDSRRKSQTAAMRKRHAKRVWKGKRRSIAEIAEMEGVDRERLYKRICEGWGLERAVIEPVKPYRKMYSGRGKEQSFQDWADELGVSRGHAYKMLEAGYSVDEIAARKKKMTLNELARLMGKAPSTVYARVRSGWSISDALFVPPERLGRPHDVEIKHGPMVGLRDACV